MHTKEENKTPNEKLQKYKNEPNNNMTEIELNISIISKKEYWLILFTILKIIYSKERIIIMLAITDLT